MIQKCIENNYICYDRDSTQCFHDLKPNANIFHAEGHRTPIINIFFYQTLRNIINIDKFSPMMDKQLFSIKSKLKNVVYKSKERCQRKGRDKNSHKPILNNWKKH